MARQPTTFLICGYYEVMIVIATSSFSPAIGAEWPTVRTKEGVVQGFTSQILGAEVDTYLGIPFAKPPLGGLRFSPPVRPADSWTGVRNSTYFRPSCIQDLASQNVPGNASEDCLYLNVFVPRNATTKTPVLFWIYGGAYRSGSATLYAGGNLAAQGQIIVVTTNYRLGALGFLTTPKGGRTVANAGVLDQRAAMQWVQENIEAFSGDKDQVAISGESAGAGSVSLHLLSPGSRNLFRRAISESGSSTSRWAAKTHEFGVNATLALSKHLGCSDGNSDWSDVMSCLRAKSAEDILTSRLVLDKQYSVSGEGLPFTPVIDGSFLPKAPLDMLRSGDFKKTEYLSGVNRDEYSLFLLPFVREYIEVDSHGQASVNSTIFEHFLWNLISKSIMAGVPPANKAMLETAAYEYTDWTNVSSDTARLQQLIKVGSDISFKCPLMILAQSWTSSANMKQGAKLFVYRFSHVSGVYPLWAGVPHSAEILYLFGIPLAETSTEKARIGNPPKSPGTYTFTEQDRRVSEQMIAMWASFVKMGNPLSNIADDLPRSVSWPLYTQQAPYYLDIGDSLQLLEGMRPRYCALWTKVMPFLSTQCDSSPASMPTTTTASSCVTSTTKSLSSAGSSKWKHAMIAILVITVTLIIVLLAWILRQRSKMGESNLAGREKLLQ